jgi:hypothetical protein
MHVPENQIRRQARFATFPDTLVIHAKKFQLVNWVPTKLGGWPRASPNFVVVVDH